jgi:hypothetical protein
MIKKIQLNKKLKKYNKEKIILNLKKNKTLFNSMKII